MMRQLVIYDFAPDPSEYTNIWGNFYLTVISVEYKNLEIKSVILGGMEQSYPLIKKATEWQEKTEEWGRNRNTLCSRQISEFGKK